MNSPAMHGARDESGLSQAPTVLEARNNSLFEGRNGAVATRDGVSDAIGDRSSGGVALVELSGEAGARALTATPERGGVRRRSFAITAA